MVRNPLALVCSFLAPRLHQRPPLCLQTPGAGLQQIAQVLMILSLPPRCGSEEEALLFVCLVMICLTLESTPGKSYVCKFQKVQRSEKRKGGMRDRIRARRRGEEAVGRINSCVFSPQ